MIIWRFVCPERRKFAHLRSFSSHLYSCCHTCPESSAVLWHIPWSRTLCVSAEPCSAFGARQRSNITEKTEIHYEINIWVDLDALRYLKALSLLSWQALLKIMSVVLNAVNFILTEMAVQLLQKAWGVFRNYRSVNSCASLFSCLFGSIPT